jgi:hypothetical protein
VGLRLVSWAGSLRGASEWRRGWLRRLAWAKEELGQRLLPSGPKARDERRKDFLFLFFSFLIFQSHFQIVFQIIFFLK